MYIINSYEHIILHFCVQEVDILNQLNGKWELCNVY